jgi:hypothetical protein
MSPCRSEREQILNTSLRVVNSTCIVAADSAVLLTASKIRFVRSLSFKRASDILDVENDEENDDEEDACKTATPPASSLGSDTALVSALLTREKGGGRMQPSNDVALLLSEGLNTGNNCEERDAPAALLIASSSVL